MADDSRHRKLHEDEHYKNGIDEIGEGTLLPQDPTEHATDHQTGGDDELNLDATQIADGSVTNVEYQYLDGVTTDVADKDYVDSKIQGVDWQKSVLEQRNDPPSTPSTGDRYLIGDEPTGDWDGEADKIAEWDGSEWKFFEPNDGWTVWIEAENKSRVYNDSYPDGEWVKMSSTVSHGSLSGLGADDHTQYLLVDGTRSMDASLDMGNNSITDVDEVDGIDISTHNHDEDAPNIPNNGLVNDSVTVTAGTNLSGGGEVALGSTITINNDISDLGDLGDVSSVSYDDGDVLRANGFEYVTATLNHDDLTGVGEDDHHDAFEALLDDEDSVVTPDANNRIKLATDGTMDAKANGSEISLSSTGEFYPKLIEQSTEPSIGTNEFVLWYDTGNDQLWVVYEYDGSNNYVELAG